MFQQSYLKLADVSDCFGHPRKFASLYLQPRKGSPPTQSIIQTFQETKENGLPQIQFQGVLPRLFRHSSHFGGGNKHKGHENSVEEPRHEMRTSTNHGPNCETKRSKRCLLINANLALSGVLLNHAITQKKKPECAIADRLARASQSKMIRSLNARTRDEATLAQSLACGHTVRASCLGLSFSFLVRWFHTHATLMLPHLPCILLSQGTGMELLNGWTLRLVITRRFYCLHHFGQQ